MSNDKPSRKNGLILVLMGLWLTGLTALFFLFMQGQNNKPLEERVAKLEKKASRVVGKIKKPGSNGKAGDVSGTQLTGLNQRISQLEKIIEQKTSEKTLSTNTPAGTSPCNCDELVSRLDKLEAMMLAKKAPKDSKVQAKAKPKTKKAVSRAKRKSPKKSKRKVAKRSTPKPKKTFKVASADIAKPARSVEYEKDYIGESVYSISRRFGPMYGYSLNEQRSMYRLAPGAAIYPGSAITHYDNNGILSKF